MAEKIGNPDGEDEERRVVGFLLELPPSSFVGRVFVSMQEPTTHVLSICPSMASKRPYMPRRAMEAKTRESRHEMFIVKELVGLQVSSFISLLIFVCF